jgi:hypothetical protein
VESNVRWRWRRPQPNPLPWLFQVYVWITALNFYKLIEILNVIYLISYYRTNLDFSLCSWGTMMVDFMISRERIIILILDSTLPPPPFDYPVHF